MWALVPGYAVLANAQPLGCPRVSRLLPKPYWARLTLLGWLEGHRGVPKSPGIKSSQLLNTVLAVVPAADIIPDEVITSLIHDTQVNNPMSTEDFVNPIEKVQASYAQLTDDELWH